MQALIYKPAKSSMQSAHNQEKWLFELIRSDESLSKEPLMARTSSRDMANQVKMHFDNLDDAINFAKKHSYSYEVIEPKPVKVPKKTYADNFK